MLVMGTHDFLSGLLFSCPAQRLDIQSGVCPAVAKVHFHLPGPPSPQLLLGPPPAFSPPGSPPALPPPGITPALPPPLHPGPPPGHLRYHQGLFFKSYKSSQFPCSGFQLLPSAGTLSLQVFNFFFDKFCFLLDIFLQVSNISFGFLFNTLVLFS